MKAYSQAQQFEPLVPQFRVAEFRQRSNAVAEASFRLASAAHPSTIASLRSLVREMNSYYSNRIEGQGTHPLNIERALRQDFSGQPEIARLQRLAVAHIEAEQAIEHHLAQGANASSSDFLRLAHSELYERLPESDRTSHDGVAVTPGGLRQRQVVVGRHQAPDHAALPVFLARMDTVYGRACSHEDLLMVAASAHHRAAWVHPFIDGNGRAIRLQTHAVLTRLNGGLWSVNRGLARDRDRYYQLMAGADAPRQGDLDGRGNLSEKALAEWCAWFISVAEDQVAFMTRMLGLNDMKQRIAALVDVRARSDKAIRKEAILPLYHLFLAGPTPRGEFSQMTGLGERTARSLLSRLIETRLVTSHSYLGPVQFGFPLDALQILLPGLYPEAAAPP